MKFATVLAFLPLAAAQQWGRPEPVYGQCDLGQWECQTLPQIYQQQCGYGPYAPRKRDDRLCQALQTVQWKYCRRNMYQPQPRPIYDQPRPLPGPQPGPQPGQDYRGYPMTQPGPYVPEQQGGPVLSKRGAPRKWIQPGCEADNRTCGRIRKYKRRTCKRSGKYADPRACWLYTQIEEKFCPVEEDD